MANRQKGVLRIGLIVLVLMLIFPPFAVTNGTRFAPYWHPPRMDTSNTMFYIGPTYASVDVELLTIQGIVAAVLTTTAIFTLPRPGRVE